MDILGNIVKGAIHMANSLTPNVKPVESQKEVLKKLLLQAKNTAFGKHYKFETILNSNNIFKTFVKTVPYFDYHKIHQQWWSKIHEGKENITWPGEPDYFALSSGTTGSSSKRIPVTEDMLDAIKSSGIKQLLSLSNFGLSADFYEKDILMLGSSTNLKERLDNRLEGEISGISASNIPFWFKPYYKPGKDIAKIEDWDSRVELIAKTANKWDVGALSGIPSWIELMLQKVIEYNNLDNIHDIWPNLQVYTSGGVAFGPYKKSFNSLLGKPVTVIDTYLASEGYIATQIRPETDAMQLNVENGIYFEFVPFKPEYINEDGSLKDEAPSYNLEQVEKNTDYVLVISTVSGAWRYMIGDTIEFTDIDKAEIKITGRTKFFLNTVGSQLSVSKMDDAIHNLERKFNTKIKEYTLAAVRDDNNNFFHHWYLGTNLKVDNQNIEKELDTFLRDVNKNYNVARNKSLKYIKVSLVDAEVFQKWHEENKKQGGQVKTERVMNEDRFRDWEEFVLLLRK